MNSMNAIDILQNHDIKKTSPRIAIIEALQGSTLPLSENEVKGKMGNLYDRITFYRSIQTLVDAGIIHKIIAANTPARYALNNCSHEHRHTVDHVHFICRQCNSLECLADVKSQQYALPVGYVNESCDVVITGLCIKCKEPFI
jgi:Fur family ferric uptake transcriptional regulator